MSADAYEDIITKGIFVCPAWCDGERGYNCKRCKRQFLDAAIVYGFAGLCLLCAHAVVIEKQYKADVEAHAQGQICLNENYRLVLVADVPVTNIVVAGTPSPVPDEMGVTRRKKRAIAK